MCETFEIFISDKLSKKTFDDMYLFFKSSKKMVTMRLRHPDTLTASQLCVLIELTGLTFEDFKPFIK